MLDRGAAAHNDDSPSGDDVPGVRLIVLGDAMHMYDDGRSTDSSDTCRRNTEGAGIAPTVFRVAPTVAAPRRTRSSISCAHA
jgi:hypothetical protein